MSSPGLEEQKKVVLPFMQRAAEMQEADPKVAYYCRMYAVEQAFKFEKRAKEINGLVSAALAQMEKEKPKLGLDKENDRFHCEALAMKVFNNADKVDRAGRADLKTATTFFAASYFLEVLNHFGPLDADLVEKQKYAAWRAAEIRKAVREGRPALPPASATPAPSTAVDDLPPAYGGNSVTSSAAAAAMDTLPSAYGGSSFTSAGSFANQNAASTSAMPPPPPQQPPPQQTWGNMPAADAHLPAPPSVPSFGPPGPAPAQPAPLPGQRFKLGSRVLYLADGSHDQPEHGTVGQVLPSQDGSCQYRLALRERLEVVPDDGRRLAPDLNEGDAVVFLAARGGPAPAHTVLVNDMPWPPSYVVRLLDGTELAASAQQLSLVEPWAAMPPAQAADAGTMPWAAMPPASSGAPTSPPKQSKYPSAYPTSQHAAPPPQQPSYPAHSAAAPQTQHARPWSEPFHTAGLQSAVSMPRGKPSVQAILDAQKNAKYAVSSLNFEDVPAAIKYLQTALNALTGQQ